MLKTLGVVCEHESVAPYVLPLSFVSCLDQSLVVYLVERLLQIQTAALHGLGAFAGLRRSPLRKVPSCVSFQGAPVLLCHASVFDACEPRVWVG